VYSLQDHTSIDALFGLQYRSCCWKVRLVAHRDIVARPSDVSERTGPRDTTFSLELELNGLATVGSSANTFLKTAIRGYSPTVAGNPLADQSPHP
jgi:LPS-assembly protein